MNIEILNIKLPDHTSESLNIDYIPDRWPSFGNFRYFAGHVEKPWVGGTAWKGYADQLERFNKFKELLKPNDEEWVECFCVAALIPPIFGDDFAIIINGLHVCDLELNRSKQRILYKEMATPITLCASKIEGGGYLPDGRHRGYRIFLDIPDLLSESELFKRQRSKEKQELYKRFKFKVIRDYYRQKLFTLFENKCFKCGVSDELDIDHHLPITLGGHLAPGNLVALCKACNNKKHDKHPDIFYSQHELVKLQPLLEKQKELFEFNFDWDYWFRDYEGYLVSIGLNPNLVHDLLTDPNHYYHIAPPSLERLGITISINLNEDE